jgi:hypothetical protein
MVEDLREQFNAFVPDCCEDVRVPRPVDPSLSDQYLGLANFGKVGWRAGV